MITNTDYKKLLIRTLKVLEHPRKASDETLVGDIKRTVEYLDRYLNETYLVETGEGAVMDGWVAREPDKDECGDVLFFSYQPYFDRNQGKWCGNCPASMCFSVNHYQGNFNDLTFKNSPRKVRLVIHKEDWK